LRRGPDEKEFSMRRLGKFGAALLTIDRPPRMLWAEILHK
jgi:hypothetical protein